MKMISVTLCNRDSKRATAFYELEEGIDNVNYITKENRIDKIIDWVKNNPRISKGDHNRNFGIDNAKFHVVELDDFQIKLLKMQNCIVSEADMMV